VDAEIETQWGNFIIALRSKNKINPCRNNHFTEPKQTNFTPFAQKISVDPDFYASNNNLSKVNLNYIKCYFTLRNNAQESSNQIIYFLLLKSATSTLIQSAYIAHETRRPTSR